MCEEKESAKDRVRYGQSKVPLWMSQVKRYVPCSSISYFPIYQMI